MITWSGEKDGREENLPNFSRRVSRISAMMNDSEERRRMRLDTRSSSSASWTKTSLSSLISKVRLISRRKSMNDIAR